MEAVQLLFGQVEAVRAEQDGLGAQSGHDLFGEGYLARSAGLRSSGTVRKAEGEAVTLCPVGNRSRRRL